MPARSTPKNYTPLAALPMAVLDLETTGLDVRRDRIIQIGAVVMLGSEILESPRIDLMVNPGVPIPPVSTRIHGLGDDDVAAAESFADCAESLQELLMGRVVVGHHIDFDLAVLRHEAARIGVPWYNPVSLDLALLVGALQPALPDFGLENICEWLGVDVRGRHTALGDSLTTARALAQLWPRLLNADIRTLAEAGALASRRADLRDRQVHAGWHAMPDDAEPARRIGPITRLDSHVYSRRLEDIMHAPPITVDPAASIHDAARIMAQQRVGALLILDSNRTPTGVVTERDVLVAVSESTDNLATVRVVDIMSAPFGRFRTEAGRVDLKRCGLLPLVSIARILALQIGSVARATPDRLREVAASGRIAAVDAERLLGIHRRLLSLILDQQMEDLQAGIRPSSRVAVNALNRPARRQLRTDLQRMDEILSVARSTLSA